jgi:hypothetical protein
MQLPNSEQEECKSGIGRFLLFLLIVFHFLREVSDVPVLCQDVGLLVFFCVLGCSVWLLQDECVNVVVLYAPKKLEGNVGTLAKHTIIFECIRKLLAVWTGRRNNDNGIESSLQVPFTAKDGGALHQAESKWIMADKEAGCWIISVSRCHAYAVFMTCCSQPCTLAKSSSAWAVGGCHPQRDDGQYICQSMRRGASVKRNVARINWYWFVLWYAVAPNLGVCLSCSLPR